MSQQLMVLLAALITFCNVVLGAQTTVPVGTGPAGIDDLKVVGLGGIEAKIERAANVDSGRPAIKISLKKPDAERRLVAVEGRPSQNLAGLQALEIRYRLQLKGGEPRLTAIVFDANGNAWYKTASLPTAQGGFTEARLPVTKMRPAAFNQHPTAELDWDTVEKVWVGVVIDGEAEGTFELSKACFTSEPYRATEPLKIATDKAEAWSIGKDPAVVANMTIVNEGPAGQPCTKLEFTFPGGRHMYLVPSTTLPVTELDGYSALEFTYRATLPPGIEGLLVMLGESGGQFMAKPMPAPADKWITITIPFADFELGAWSKDDNGQLDIDRVQSLMIGTHGTARQEANGVILVTDIKFIP
ncbi:MAG: hypothetical protein ACUVX8_07350 [Candidatus Zipacnadales bacterium]